jgi:hypothetical protein
VEADQERAERDGSVRVDLDDGPAARDGSGHVVVPDLSVGSFGIEVARGAPGGARPVTPERDLPVATAEDLDRRTR